MTQEQIDYVKKCIREDIHRFYVWGPWKKVRREVLQMDHGECQRCKARVPRLLKTKVKDILVRSGMGEITEE